MTLRCGSVIIGVYQPKKGKAPVKKMLNIKAVEELRNLCKKTVKELRTICKELGIKGYSRARKADLVLMISEVYESGFNIERANEADLAFFQELEPSVTPDTTPSTPDTTTPSTQEFNSLEDKEYEEVDNQPELMDNQLIDYVMFLERCFRIPYEYEVYKDPTDIMQELSRKSRESRESCIARTIRSYNMPYPGTYKKKDNYTVYGASPKFEQSRLRRGYGDVFAVFVGGPCDTSPL